MTETLTPLSQWVEEQARLTQPDKIHWCDGSETEARHLIEIGIKEERIQGRPVFHELDQKLWPNSFYHQSDPTDVARTESLTFICHPDKETVGPNNNWMDPDSAKKMLTPLTKGCMKGRTMYVLPYMMGRPGSPYAKACVQLTDSVYVAVSMRIMTYMGKAALDRIGSSENFVKGLHSIGDLDPKRRFIVHFPLENFVWSIGSGYGGNALLGKKCFALRIASWLGKNEGWLAEHMMIIGVQDPEGHVTYITGAFPSACGKTNLALLESKLPGYKIWTLGDDIAWLNIGPDGRLWAINPEAGFFGVAPGTSLATNPNMIRTLKKGTFYPTLFTNTAIDPATNEPWWQGKDGPVPEKLIDWQGRPWTRGSDIPAAHPNSRFTVSLSHCPVLSPEAGNPQGVPISAIIFGSRMSQLVPLVMESFDWDHGVFLGAQMGSESTAAASGKVGVLKRDPMAMAPFCGYNMGDYFAHWCAMGKKLKQPPKIFRVDWFRKDPEGKYLWPGFGDNVRVLKWIVDRVQGRATTRKTPLGLVPHVKDLDLDGLSISPQDMERLFEVRMEDWRGEITAIHEFLGKFGTHTPRTLWDQCRALESSLPPLPAPTRPDQLSK